jgi:hypothetical protein
LNRCEIVDPHIFADPTVVADLEPPWKLDANSRFDHYAFSDPCSEGSKNQASMKAAGNPRSHKDGVQHEPQGLE